MEPAGSWGDKPVVGSSAGADDGGVDANAVICSGIQRDFDLNVVAGDDVVEVEGGGLHGVDLNEGVNYILHEGSSGAKRKLNDLNQDAAMNEEEVETVKRVKWRRLRVEGDKGKAVLEETPPPQVAEPPHALQMAPPRLNLGGALQRPSRRANAVVGGGERKRRGRNNGGGVLPFSAYDYGMYAAGVFNQLPFNPVVSAALPAVVVQLPPPSASWDLRGASLFDFLSIYGFLRSFSSLLFLSPFEVDEFAAALICNDSTSLFDSVHLSLLRAIRPYLRRLSAEGSESASSCLRSLNWDLLDSITWPVFLVEYLLLHKPKHIPGLELSEFHPFQRDYYSMPSSAKLEILQQLCDDLIETEGCRSELSKRIVMAESDSWKMRYFSSKEDDHHEYDDENGNECYLCKMDGIMICCDACPAAIHSRCVGVVSSLLPEGDWHCPECTLNRGKPYDLSRCIRGTTLLATDPQGRLYYTISDYLVVSELCGEESSFLVYKRDDLPAVVAALESSPLLHEKTIRAIRKHWNLPHGASHHQLEISHRPPAITETAERGNNNIIPLSAIGDGGASSSASQEILGTRYVNLYEFAFMASSFRDELASDKSSDDARTADQIMARQLKIVMEKNFVFSWSNMCSLNLHLNTKRENCGWCFTCRNAEDGRDCLFVANGSARAIESFTSEALGIQWRNGMKKHLVDVTCHVVWIESRLQGLLQGRWSNPRHSHWWRRNVVEAAHVSSLKKLLLQLESSLDRRALSADWTKHVDTAFTKGSASHFVRKSMRSVPLVIRSSSKRKCPRQEVVRTPEAAAGLSLFWWRDGRASRDLFNWKVLPHSLASNSARQGGSSKIAGVHYSDSIEYAKRMKYIAWRAAVEGSRSVRELDANIRWNDIENINVVPKREKESKKCIKAFKNASVRSKRCEGGVVKYLIHFNKCRSSSLPYIVLRHGSLHPDPSSKRRKYWLEESHVPLHLLKKYEEKQLVRAANRHAAAGEPPLEATQETGDEPPLKRSGFDYLFERVEREAVNCQYCQGLFHRSHAEESASTSGTEPLYTCQKCYDERNKKASKGGKRLRKSKKLMEAEDDQEIEWWMKDIPKKKRASKDSSSFWLNGVHLSRRSDDERLFEFRSRMLLVLSGEHAPIDDDEPPKCSLCGELEHSPNLSYIACEICGVWCHGDALDIGSGKMENIIGFKCHNCLNKRPHVCPHQQDDDGSLEDETISEYSGGDDWGEDAESEDGSTFEYDDDSEATL
ncbi:hypothetical protein C2S53_009907 [Perilla frutescens var. hirtella]|uniref:Uncharacterized protein n=1 Tax=Perilla frutescens var. hirtella TaxID=608512 RepID=A0AAD4IND8_PERFH|nr:hypothetical protein C2S53_009907 [Perilla frutescens var. hirtella]